MRIRWCILRTLITGPEGCGKTAFCQRMTESARAEGATIGGVLSRSVYLEGMRVGADAIDLLTGRRALICRLTPLNASAPDTYYSGRLLLRQGLDFARAALEEALRQPTDLIVVDEFGPLELAGGGLRQETEDVWRSGRDVLLVVRESIAEEAMRALGQPPDLRMVPHIPLAAATPVRMARPGKTKMTTLRNFAFPSGRLSDLPGVA